MTALRRCYRCWIVHSKQNKTSRSLNTLLNLLTIECGDVHQYFLRKWFRRVFTKWMLHGTEHATHHTSVSLVVEAIVQRYKMHTDTPKPAAVCYDELDKSNPVVLSRMVAHIGTAATRRTILMASIVGHWPSSHIRNDLRALQAKYRALHHWAVIVGLESNCRDDSGLKHESTVNGTKLAHNAVACAHGSVTHSPRSKAFHRWVWNIECLRAARAARALMRDETKKPPCSGASPTPTTRRRRRRHKLGAATERSVPAQPSNTIVVPLANWSATVGAGKLHTLIAPYRHEIDDGRQARETSVASSLSCIVCMAGIGEWAFIPCGHRCLCSRCLPLFQGDTRQSCPVCRGPATTICRIYG